MCKQEKNSTSNNVENYSMPLEEDVNQPKKIIQMKKEALKQDGTKKKGTKLV